MIDFEQCIQMNKPVFDRFSVRCLSANLCLPLKLEEANFDVIMACEVIEHIPRPPRELFEEMCRRAKDGAVIVVSTPNLARIENIIKLLLARPILGDPDLTFGLATFENEACHRREYTEKELKDIGTRAGLRHISTAFLWNNRRSETLIFAHN